MRRDYFFYKIKEFYLSGFLVLILLSFSEAGTLTNWAKFNRCYTQITQLVPRRSNTLSQKVISGQVDAVDACLSILDRTQLGANLSVSDSADREISNTLRTFHQLHSTWFYGKTFPDIGGNFANRGTPAFLDSSAPAFYVTRALLDATVDYTYVFTTEDNLIASRADNAPSKFKTADKTNTLFGDKAIFAPVGQLNGVQVSGPLVASYSVQVGNRTLSGSVDFAKTNGAGVLGSPVYLLENAESEVQYVADGAVKTPRRWSRSVFNDFLCRELPAVRMQDANAPGFVVASSSVPFRQSTACTVCHSSMDRLAGVVRGTTYQSAQVNNNNLGIKLQGFNFASLANPSAGNGPGGWPSEPDSQYSTYLPRGQFYFRNYKGELLDFPVENLRDFGKKLIQIDDLYLCAAKRYYKYFIGVDVFIGDLQDPNMTLKMTTSDQKHRDQVIQLGLKFKQTRKLKKLIEDILRSPSYGQGDLDNGK